MGFVLNTFIAAASGFKYCSVKVGEKHKVIYITHVSKLIPSTHT